MSLGFDRDRMEPTGRIFRNVHTCLLVLFATLAFARLWTIDCCVFLYSENDPISMICQLCPTPCYHPANAGMVSAES